jgi:hypothetical protein
MEWSTPRVEAISFRVKTPRGDQTMKGDQTMLRIEKQSDGCVTRLLLSGRIQSDRIACIRSAMNDGCARKILDLSEITLVDVAVVRFLIRCEDEGIELEQCPSWVREWILRERAEGA